MILRKGAIPSKPRSADDETKFGPMAQKRLSDLGGLTQFGLYSETLYPGARSSDRHWHEEEDEFLYMIQGEATLIENDGQHAISVGDAIAWKAGDPNGHQIVNTSNAPCTYLIMGTRVGRDTTHYPDLGLTQFDRPPDWWIEDRDGNRLRGGKI